MYSIVIRLAFQVFCIDYFIGELSQPLSQLLNDYVSANE